MTAREGKLPDKSTIHLYQKNFFKNIEQMFAFFEKVCYTIVSIWKKENIMKNNDLSKKEKLVFDYLVESINENGYAPSVRDIGASLGI